MEKFTVLEGVAAPLKMINVDTDRVIPKQYLKTIKRTGLGKGLFAEMRYQADGSENPDFVLNRPRYKGASVLLARANFGCGSSREHAPWAIGDYDFRVILAPSYADIFYNNCFKNGILPAELTEAQIEELFQRTEKEEGYSLTVDLPSQTVKDNHGLEFKFDINPSRKEVLLKGLDDIAQTLLHAGDIDIHEKSHAASATMFEKVDVKYYSDAH